MLAGEKKADRESGAAAAGAIMTTDTRPKEAAVTFDIGGKTVTIGGMAKGSGMIHPNMCTMLCFHHHGREDFRKETAAEGAERGCGRYLQYDLRGRRHLHQRHSAAAGKRHGRERRRSGMEPRNMRHSARLSIM